MPRRLALRFPPEENPEQLDAEELLQRAAGALGWPVERIGALRHERTSFDARAEHMEWRVGLTAWTVDEEPPEAEDLEPPKMTPPPADAPHVVVVGSGPAGLFAALELLRAGLRVTVLERGKDVQTRRRDLADLNRGTATNPESNYCFGEGGAGTYSDGKLYTRSGDKEAVHQILVELVRHGAPEHILWSWRPHIGSNRLPKVVTALRETIERAGTVRFAARVTELLTEETPADPSAAAATRVRRVTGVKLFDGETIDCDAVVLATGHSALDAVTMARDAGAQLAPKGFAVGVRVEHPQAWLDEQQYHGAKEHAELPPAFYELSTQADERGVYSFCMCPGGWIVPAQTQPGTLVVNGMSLSKRDSPFANSGVVVELQPKDWCGKRGWRQGWPEVLKRAAEVSDHPLLHEVVEDPRGGPPLDVAAGRLPVHPDIDPLFGIRLQVALEALAAHAGGGNNQAPTHRCDLFVAGEGPDSEPLPTSYLPGLTPADLREILPKGVARRIAQALESFDQLVPGFAGPFGQLVGVETRTSSPVRILRNGPDEPHPDQCTTLAGLYPVGEGAGYAGGIVSAALDGRRIAASLARALHETQQRA